MIQGGWEYVLSAYGIAWMVLGGYAGSLWIRHRWLIKKETSLK